MSSMNLYVGNLSFDTTEAKLESLFGQFGQVQSVKIIMDRYSGRSRGFAFVEMSSRSEGEQAMASLNGKDVDNRQIKVNEAKPNNKRSGGGGGGGGYGDHEGGWK